MRSAGFLIVLTIFVLLCAKWTLAQQKQLEVKVVEIKPTNKGNYIYFDSTLQLKWSDFKNKPDYNSPYQAITSSGIKMEFEAHEKNDVKTVNIKLYCYFDKDKSWHKEPVNDTMLKHELYHYKITAYHFLSLKLALEKQAFSYKNIVQEASTLFAEYQQRNNQMQQLYDEESEHCINMEKQFAWEQKIDKWLAEIYLGIAPK